MELRKMFITIPLAVLVLGGRFSYGQTEKSPTLYNAHKGITFLQDKELRLDSCIIDSQIYNDSTRMDIVYYVTNISCLHPIRLLLPDFGWFREYSKNQIKLKKDTLWDIYINGEKVSNDNIHFTYEYNRFSIEAERMNLSAELSWLLYNERVDSVNLLYGGVKMTDEDNFREYMHYPSKENRQAAENAIRQLELQRKEYLESNNPEKRFNYSSTFAYWAQFEIGHSYKIRISYRTSPSYNLATGLQKWFQYCFDEMEYFMCDESVTEINISVPSSGIIGIEHLHPSDCLIDYDKGTVRYKIIGDSVKEVHDITFLYQLVSDKIAAEREPYPRAISFDQ